MALAGLTVLRDRMRRVAFTGRPQLTQARAVDLIHAMGTVTVLALPEKAPADREGVPDAARDAVFAAVIGEASTDHRAGAAGALRAGLA